MYVDKILDKMIKFFSYVFIVIVMFVFMMIGYVQIDSLMSRQTINEGFVLNKGYDDGSYYYSTWVFGNYSISKRNGGMERFYVEVVNDKDVHDYWTVDEEVWNHVSIGDYLRK